MRARSKGQRSWPGSVIACSRAVWGSVSVRGSVMAWQPRTTRRSRGESRSRRQSRAAATWAAASGAAAGVDGGFDEVEEHPQGVGVKGVRCRVG